MRGSDERSGSLFSYVDLEGRVRADHPLRVIRELANTALGALSGEFSKLYTDFGRPSIAPEKLLRAMLLQVFYGVRSERHLMERMEFDLLFRWFVGLGIDDAVWDHSTFSKIAASSAAQVAGTPDRIGLPAEVNSMAPAFVSIRVHRACRTPLSINMANRHRSVSSFSPSRKIPTAR
jgi:hypothetical protein